MIKRLSFQIILLLIILSPKLKGESFEFLRYSADTISNTSHNNILDAKKKSPTGALLRSLAIPGWGQIYVRQYWKAPLFLAGTLVMYYYTFKHNSAFLDYSRQYDDLFRQNPNDPSLYIIRQKRENARDNRDISIFFLCGVYAISMLDAYVGAHLFNFDVSEKLTIRINPGKDRFSFDFSYLLFKY